MNMSQYPLEDYVKDWTKKDSVLGEVESIYVEVGHSTMNGAELVPIGYEKDGTIGLEQDGISIISQKCSSILKRVSGRFTRLNK